MATVTETGFRMFTGDLPTRQRGVTGSNKPAWWYDAMFYAKQNAGQWCCVYETENHDKAGRARTSFQSFAGDDFETASRNSQTGVGIWVRYKVATNGKR
jgi:hypothetical protein